MSATKRVRHPRSDGYVCLVKDCSRVEYKHGLCRKHWNEVPLAERLRIMQDVIVAAHQAAGKHDASLSEWARNYPTGVAASQGRRA